jgi:hypothetical protein
MFLKRNPGRHSVGCESRKTGLSDLLVVLRGIETRADAPDDLAIGHERQRSLGPELRSSTRPPRAQSKSLGCAVNGGRMRRISCAKPGYAWVVQRVRV